MSLTFFYINENFTKMLIKAKNKIEELFSQFSEFQGET